MNIRKVVETYTREADKEPPEIKIQELDRKFEKFIPTNEYKHNHKEKE